MYHLGTQVGRRWIAAVLLTVALLAALGIYGALRLDGAESMAGSAVSASSRDPATAAKSPAATSTDTPSRAVLGPAPLAVTDDPTAYAAAVASLLFGMDQRVYSGGDYLNTLVAARSPGAADLIPELTDDAFLDALSERIPDDYMWQRMRDSGQYATFEVTRVWEPEYVAAKRANGELPDGVVGLDVAGTQTIYYLDENDEPAQRERDQSVSLLVACAPVQTECGLIAVSTGVVE